MWIPGLWLLLLLLLLNPNRTSGLFDLRKVLIYFDLKKKEMGIVFQKETKG